jgi:hypothetical protein
MIKVKNKWAMSVLLFIIIGTSLLAFCSERKTNATSLNKEPNSNNMKKILVIGIDPKTIDFSNPDLVPGLTVEKIEMGMKAEKEKLHDLGFETEFFLFDLKETDVSKLKTFLKTKRYNGIVVGAGIRVPQNTFILFEKIINAIHEYAPGSKIMFNTLPTNTAEAIQRWL